MKIQTYFCDEQALTALMHGSDAAFRYIYDKYYSRINLFAYHIVMCEESHDIIHDVFIKLWENKKTLSITTNLSTYLYVAVKNSCFNYLKRNKILDKHKHKLVEALLFVHEASDEEEIDLETVKRLIEQLPEQQQKIIVLRFEGKSYEEISLMLGVSLRTVNTHVYRAYNFIRKNVLIITHLIIFISKINKIV